MAEAEEENYAKLQLIVALGLIPIEEFGPSLTESIGMFDLKKKILSLKRIFKSRRQSL